MPIIMTTVSPEELRLVQYCARQECTTVSEVLRLALAASGVLPSPLPKPAPGEAARLRHQAMVLLALTLHGPLTCNAIYTRTEVSCNWHNTKAALAALVAQGDVAYSPTTRRYSVESAG